MSRFPLFLVSFVLLSSVESKSRFIHDVVQQSGYAFERESMTQSSDDVQVHEKLTSEDEVIVR